jgi:predicted site-specific integrase-resolvase
MPDALGHSEQEAARIIGVSVRTLRRWRSKGAVGYSLTPGGRIRYTNEDLHRLRRSMTVGAEMGRQD